jgi:hypothetical protein
MEVRSPAVVLKKNLRSGQRIRGSAIAVLAGIAVLAEIAWI